MENMYGGNRILRSNGPKAPENLKIEKTVTKLRANGELYQSLLGKYGALLSPKDINTITALQLTDLEKHQKAYTLAYHKYGTRYARKTDQLFNLMGKLYTVYAEMPEQPPCPTLGYVPKNAKDQTKRLLAQKARNMVTGALKQSGHMAIDKIKQLTGLHDKERRRSINRSLSSNARPSSLPAEWDLQTVHRDNRTKKIVTNQAKSRNQRWWQRSKK